jgi:hypothetical protein
MIEMAPGDTNVGITRCSLFVVVLVSLQPSINDAIAGDQTPLEDGARDPI